MLYPYCNCYDRYFVVGFAMRQVDKYAEEQRSAIYTYKYSKVGSYCTANLEQLML